MSTSSLSTTREQRPPKIIAGTQRVFPLYLAPIDAFFLLDDRPDYPMTYASNLFFAGTFQQQAFESALDDALALHPLLHALVRPAKQNKLCWVSALGNPVIDWGDLDDPIDIDQNESIDLRKEPGLRVWVRQSGGRAHLVLQFHHACCDGTGAHRFMGDLLAAYGIRTAETEQLPSMASYDPQLLKLRRAKLSDEFMAGQKIAAFRRTLAQGVTVFGRRIAPLSTKQHEEDPITPPVAVPGVVSFAFDRNQHKQLRAAASHAGVNLNDMLLAEMFRAMCDWNGKRGASSRQRLRIMMPTDLRGKDDYAMPAANMTSYNFITRTRHACGNNTKLVKGIRDETARIKHEGRGRNFIDSIMCTEMVPGLLPFLISGKRCLSTVTVSHMGDPTRRFLATFPRKNGKLVCGDVVLDNMVGVSPLRPQTRAAVSIVTLYRKLAINLRFDPHTMTLGDSQAFLDNYVSKLKAHLA